MKSEHENMGASGAWSVEHGAQRKWPWCHGHAQWSMARAALPNRGSQWRREDHCGPIKAQEIDGAAPGNCQLDQLDGHFSTGSKAMTTPFWNVQARPHQLSCLG